MHFKGVSKHFNAYQCGSGCLRRFQIVLGASQALREVPRGVQEGFYIYFKAFLDILLRPPQAFDEFQRILQAFVGSQVSATGFHRRYRRFQRSFSGIRRLSLR